MNKVIGLCHNNSQWPNILYKSGYRVALIEQSIHVTDDAKIRPDIVASSGKQSHALVIDCKSGMNLNKTQESKYSKLTTKKLRMWADAKPGLKSHDITYAINKDNQDRIMNNTQYPIIVFDIDEITKIHKFKDNIEQQIEFPVSLADMNEPINYYPFSIDDNNVLIMSYILQGLMTLLSSKNFGVNLNDVEYVDEILKKTHTCYEFISDGEKRKLVTKIKDIIDEYLMTNEKVKNK